MSSAEKNEYIQESSGLFDNKSVDELPFYDDRFALKIQYTDVLSEAYVEDLQSIAMEAGVHNILFPFRMWKGLNVLDDIRGWSGPTFTDMRATQTDRQAVISLSAFKRTLHQFRDVREVLIALRDVVNGVKGLSDIGVLHRDISPWNILLADDLISAPEHQHTDLGLFIRRPHGPQSGGLIHDLDMCGRVSTEAPDIVGVQERMLDRLEFILPDEVEPAQPHYKIIRTGTTPFMSISVLERWNPHSVNDDIESIF
ncbi:hypothetical protein DFH09DRAFT_348136 [Mycena vulgaris]|nr:hypothetical protein DFH09DRAFT_348136 [Mycena vulgaris]